MTLGPAALILFPSVMLEYLTNGAAPDVLVWICLAGAVGWMVFVGWRGVRVAKAATIKGDRDYDQKTKFMLPPEYADSESLRATNRRKHLGAGSIHGSRR